MRVLNSTDFGTDFGTFCIHLECESVVPDEVLDFTAAEAVVEATHRYKEIFYGDD